MYETSFVKKNKFIILAVLLALVTIVVVLYLLVPRHEGEYKVTISVVPEDATILIDNKEVSIDNIWLTPGEYEFTAEKEGFAPDRVSRVITQDTTVTLLPAPTSDEAIAWASQAEVQLQIEGLSGQKANERGVHISGQNPIIDQLPYVDIAGPFKIDYGYHGADNTATYLIIHKTTPNGRQAALEWIRKQGYDPTQLDIRFTDFKNPLLEGDS